MAEDESVDVDMSTAKTVGQMEVTEFFSLMLQVMDRRREKGDPHLVDMTIKEFASLMLDQLKSRSLATASVETSTAERVLTDWQGIQKVDAITQPFRVASHDDVRELATSLLESFDDGFAGEFVIAVAITTAPGVYAPRPR